MAESPNSNDNWLSSWLNAAKNKSTEVLEFVKKDLEEFGSVVKNEATSVVSSTGAVIEKTLKLDEPSSTASTMKRSFSSFLEQMNTALNPSPDDSETEAILITEGSETVTLSKLQKAVYELQKNDKTFLDDPESILYKQYQCWLEIMDEEVLAEEKLAKHLTSSAVLNNQYLKFVPDQVTHQLFWKRYLFRKALMEDEMAREEAMARREVKEKQMTEEHLKWEQEDFASEIELSEEEQIRLLQQYEEETKSKSPSPKRQPLSESSPSNNPPTQPTSTIEPPIQTIADEQMDVARKEDHFNNEKNNAQRNRATLGAIKNNDSTTSLDLETKSSTSSTDGEWEKIGDVDK